MSKELAINLDAETLQGLDFIGETAAMPQHQLAEEAVRSYSLATERYIKAVQQGQADIRNGKVITHKQLVEKLESRIADLG